MSTTKALNLYWSKFKSFSKLNWKYAAFFGFGSLLTFICSIFYVKKLTGWTTMEFIINFFIAREESKYRNLKNVNQYKGFSNYTSPIRPSSRLLAWDSLFRNNKEKIKSYPTEKDWRDDLLKYRKKNASFNSSPRALLPHYVSTPENIIFKDTSFNNQGPIKGTKLIYPGAKIENGVIYWIHGGGFFLGFPAEGYPMCCIMAQYLGMIIISIDYHYCPEISLPQQVDECIIGYKYILNKLGVNSKKIFITGGSAGGGLLLLTLQKLNKQGLPQPCGAIPISPITDISWQTAINTQNKNGIIDAMVDMRDDFLNTEICIDNIDRKKWNKYKRGSIERKNILKQSKYSALYGSFKGLCPLYISASQNEVLINDSKLIIDKCKQYNVECEYDWDPYLLHATIAFAGGIPEARDKLIIVIQWMKKQLKLHK